MKFFRTLIFSGLFLIFIVASIYAAVNGVAVQPLSPNAGMASVYEIRFKLTEPFPSAGSLTLEFPREFDLSQAILAGSPNVKGGFKVFVDGQRVRIQRSGLGQAVPAGTEIVVRVANVKNPKSPGQFGVKMDVQAGKRILGTANGVSFSVLPKKRPVRPVK